MLLWRIGVDALPTKVNLNRKLNHIDPTCISCNSGDETCVHLFFECPFSRALWDSACWGIRFNGSSFVSNEDIVKLIISPLSSPLPAHDQCTILLKMAIIVDEIWRTRNLTQFQEGNVDIHKSKQIVLSRFVELSKTFSVLNTTLSVQPISVWTPPPLGWIKLNVNAALNNSKSALAVVARNYTGEILFIWCSGYHLCAPSQAEVAATLWAVHLAIQEHWKYVIIEGDALVCRGVLANRRPAGTDQPDRNRPVTVGLTPPTGR
ncbi:uncharacterized protein LOC126721935 [Quercus robur]|uniref:uncharacterized protein LOC126721935 n=1 Tax=Quercus robur TaxID=38942 RepID=UPI002161E57D|nr:uncharacterized protein LOC126721935 [Quercus robur]